MKNEQLLFAFAVGYFVGQSRKKKTPPPPVQGGLVYPFGKSSPPPVITKGIQPRLAKPIMLREVSNGQYR